MEVALLAASKRVLGPDHPNTLNAASSLGETLLLQGKHMAAEALVRTTFVRTPPLNRHTHAHTSLPLFCARGGSMHRCAPPYKLPKHCV